MTRTQAMSVWNNMSSEEKCELMDEAKIDRTRKPYDLTGREIQELVESMELK